MPYANPQNTDEEAVAQRIWNEFVATTDKVAKTEEEKQLLYLWFGTKLDNTEEEAAEEWAEIESLIEERSQVDQELAQVEHDLKLLEGKVPEAPKKEPTKEERQAAYQEILQLRDDYLQQSNDIKKRLNEQREKIRNEAKDEEIGDIKKRLGL